MKKDDQQGKDVKANHDKKEDKEEKNPGYRKSLLIKSIITETYYEKLPNAIRINPELDWIDKGIFMELLGYVDERHWACFPGIDTMCASVGISRRTLEGRLKRLKNLGYIDWNRSKFSNFYVITEKIIAFHRISKIQLERPGVKKLISDAQILRMSRCAESAHEKQGLDAQILRTIKDSQYEDSEKKTLKCKKQTDFSDEKPDTHTGRKTGHKKQEWKRKGGGVEGEGKNSKSGTVSKNASHQGTGKIPPTPFRTKTVGNGKLDSRKLLVGASESNQGEKGMQWGKNAGKGALTKNKGIDNTEGLALSKFKQTGRKDKPEKAKTPWPSRAKKPSTKVRDFQRYFQDKTGSREECRPYEYGLVEQLVKELGFDMSRALVDYAVENWSQLRGQDSALHIDANINQLLLKSRYQKWISKIKQSQKTENLAQNLPKTPSKGSKVVFQLNQKLHAVK